MSKNMKNITSRFGAALIGFLFAFGIIFTLERFLGEMSFVLHSTVLIGGVLIGGYIHEILLKRFVSKANQK